MLQGMTYKVDAKLNQALYGDATPQTILSGQVTAPEAMQELYTAIDEASAVMCIFLPSRLIAARHGLEWWVQC